MSTNDENKIYPTNEDNINDNTASTNEDNINYNTASTNEDNINYNTASTNEDNINYNTSSTSDHTENTQDTQSSYSNLPPQAPITPPAAPQPPKDNVWDNVRTTSTWTTPVTPQTNQQYKAQQRSQIVQQQFQQSNQQQPNQQQPNQQQPNQQTQWTFQDYNYNNGKPPKPPKPPKQPKQGGGNTGIKIFATIVSIMFLLTLSSLAAYVIYNDQNGVEQGGLGTSSHSASSVPQLNTQDKPEGNTPVMDESGRMSGVEINKRVSPSVVGVVSYIQSVGYQVAGQGSGIIMTREGYIVTNNHVITSEDPRYPIAKVEIFLSTGENYIATIIGKDPKTDLAVLKIDGKNLPSATFGDSSKLEVGEPVYVIGNPSGLEFAGSMTSGIVSAVNRELNQTSIGQNNKFIQTNAAINPGNSGGALVNEFGQIVGITSNKVVATGFEGMGFAIPSNDTKVVVDSIVQNGYVKGRVKVGIMYSPIGETFSKLNGIPMGLRVESFDQGSQPDVQGVLPGDIITKMDDKDVYDSGTIKVALEGKVPGDPLELTIYRVDRATGIANTIKITVALVEDQG